MQLSVLLYAQFILIVFIYLFIPVHHSCIIPICVTHNFAHSQAGLYFDNHDVRRGIQKLEEVLSRLCIRSPKRKPWVLCSLSYYIKRVKRVCIMFYRFETF